MEAFLEMRIWCGIVLAGEVDVEYLQAHAARDPEAAVGQLEIFHKVAEGLYVQGKEGKCFRSILPGANGAESESKPPAMGSLNVLGQEDEGSKPPKLLVWVTNTSKI